MCASVATTEDKICKSSCNSDNQQLVDSCAEYCESLQIPSYGIVWGSTNFGISRSEIDSIYTDVSTDTVTDCGLDYLSDLTQDLRQVLYEPDTSNSVILKIAQERASAQKIVSEQQNTISEAAVKFVNSAEGIEASSTEFIKQMGSILENAKPEAITEYVNSIRSEYNGISTRADENPTKIKPIVEGLKNQIERCSKTLTTAFVSMCAPNANQLDNLEYRVWCSCQANPITSVNSKAKACNLNLHGANSGHIAVPSMLEIIAIVFTIFALSTLNGS